MSAINYPLLTGVIDGHNQENAKVHDKVETMEVERSKSLLTGQTLASQGCLTYCWGGGR